MIKLLSLLLFTSLLTSCSAKADLADCKAGIEANEKKKYIQAIDSLSKCLDLPLKSGPKAQILAVRADSYFNIKQSNLAVDDQKQSIELQEPKDVWPLLGLGAYYRELKQYDKSLEAINSAFKYDEDGPGTGPGMACYYHKAKTLHQAGRYSEAIESYTLGIPKQPDYGYALYERALSYEALGNKEQAKRDLFRAYELTPKEGYEPEIAAKLKGYGFDVKVRED
jgi:tetratricopeptide (TPR) repeat protein